MEKTENTNTTNPFRAWEQQAAAGDIDEAVVAYVAANDCVSFSELVERFAAWTETRGEMALDLRPNVVLFSGVSESFALILQDLLARERLYLHPATRGTYYRDRGKLWLPLLVPRCDCTKPHWLPVCLRTVPRQGKRVGEGVPKES
jgi:hypothetical protein